MTRSRSVPCVILALVALCALDLGLTAQGAPDRARAGVAERSPNVLILLVDDLRRDALGAAGNPHARTPNLDALAEDSARFENTYCFGLRARCGLSALESDDPLWPHPLAHGSRASRNADSARALASSRASTPLRPASGTTGRRASSGCSVRGARPK